MFENKSSTERAMLMEKFTSFKIRSIRDIGVSIGELQALAARLRSLRANVDEEFVVSILLKALPNTLKTWKSTWMMVNAKEPKLNQLITGIRAEISTLDAPEDVALIAMEKPWNKTHYEDNYGQYGLDNSDTGRNKYGPNKRKICHYCKKQGHWIRDCRKRLAEERDGRLAAEP